MLISHSHRFIFIHVGKTGGMSMREVLKRYAQEPEKFRIRRPPQMNGDRPNPLYAVWETLLLHAKARDVQKEVPARSEEHTSELQSRPHLVCRLLLEKKKNKAYPHLPPITKQYHHPR